MKRIRILASALIACVMVSTASAQDIEERFAQLQVGDRRAVVIETMGAPSTAVEENLLGLTYSTVRWVFRERVFVAVFLHDRLIRTRSCVGAADC